MCLHVRLPCHRFATPSRHQSTSLTHVGGQALTDMGEREAERVFRGYVRECQREEEERQREEREKRRKAERRNRENFRQFLKAKAKAAELTCKTRWHDFKESVADSEELKAMEGQEGTSAHDLFDDMVDNLGHELRKHSKFVRRLCKEHGFELVEGATFEAFVKASGLCQGVTGARARGRARAAGAGARREGRSFDLCVWGQTLRCC